MIDLIPKSPAQALRGVELIHKDIVRFIKKTKGDLKRGFAFSTVPMDDIYFYTLLEFQENPDLLGCDNKRRSQILEILGTYDFADSYIYIIRVDNEPIIRWVVRSGPLDEDGVQQIITLQEIQREEAVILRAGMIAHAAVLRNKRKGKSLRVPKPKKWRWPSLFTLTLIQQTPAKELCLAFQDPH
jgi:hypothetical protein